MDESQSQTTVSTLTVVETPDHNVADMIVRTANTEMNIAKGDVAEPVLPPIKSIFDCPYVVKTILNDGRPGWDCLWCGKRFSPRHSTRALRHVLKIKKGNIAVCTAAISDQYRDQYKVLFNNFSDRSFARKRSHEEVHDVVAASQDASVETLLEKRGIMVS